MVQVIGPSTRSLERGQLAAAAGKGLTKFIDSYNMNRSIDQAMNSAEYKSGTPYERADVLQRALYGHGDQGRQFLQDRLQLEGRRNFENALEKAKKLANDPKASNMDIMLALAETGVDGKQLQTFYQAIQQNRQANRQSTEPEGQGRGEQPQGQGNGQPQGTPAQVVNPTQVNKQLAGLDNQGQPGQPQQQTPTAQDKFPTNLPSPTENPFINDSTLEAVKSSGQKVPLVYSADQIKEFRILDRKDGNSGQPDSREMEAERYNQDKRLEANDLLKSAQDQFSVSEMARKGQAEFRSVMTNQLGKINTKTGERYLEPEDLAVAEAIAAKSDYQKIGNDVTRVSAMAPEYHNYEVAKAEFSNFADKPNFFLKNDLYNEKLNNAESKAEDLLKLGMAGRNQAMNLMAQDGWSESQIAYGLNPLPAKIKKEATSLPKFEKNRAFDARISMPGQQTNSQKMKIYEDFFEKNIKKGDFEKSGKYKPGPSIILLKNQAMKNGLSSPEYNNLINNLVKEGRIELDPYQKREFQMMGQDPRRIWSIEESLFGDIK